jgi:large subunit ribosomal protein L28
VLFFGSSAKTGLTLVVAAVPEFRREVEESTHASRHYLEVEAVSVSDSEHLLFTGTKLIYRSLLLFQATVPSRGDNTALYERKCDLLGKTANRKARVVTFSHKRIHKVQNINLQKKRYYSDNLKRTIMLRVSTKGIKTINKYGSVDAAAKKLGVDLSKL